MRAFALGLIGALAAGAAQAFPTYYWCQLPKDCGTEPTVSVQYIPQFRRNSVGLAVTCNGPDRSITEFMILWAPNGATINPSGFVPDRLDTTPSNQPKLFCATAVP